MPVIGMAPSWISTARLDSEFIIKQLNLGNAFDFEYKPQTNDKLTIHTLQENLVLHYERGSWTHYHEEVGARILFERMIGQGGFEEHN